MKHMKKKSKVNVTAAGEKITTTLPGALRKLCVSEADLGMLQHPRWSTL